MARFTSDQDLNLRWGPYDFDGAAGTLFSIADSLVAAFKANPGPAISGLAWPFDVGEDPLHGPVGGDLSGTLPDPTVAKVQGVTPDTTGLDLLADATPADARTTLGLGTAATHAATDFDAAGAAAAITPTTLGLGTAALEDVGLTVLGNIPTAKVLGRTTAGTGPVELVDPGAQRAAGAVGDIAAETFGASAVAGATGKDADAGHVHAMPASPTLADLSGQPLDSDLTAIAALTTTAYGRAFLAMAGASDLTALTSGSTLPTQPAYGSFRPFFYIATGYNETVYYDGTRWLGPEQVVSWPAGVTAGVDQRRTATALNDFKNWATPGYALLITNIDVSAYDEGDGSSGYWCMDVYTTTTTTKSSRLSRAYTWSGAYPIHQWNRPAFDTLPLVIAATVNYVGLDITLVNTPSGPVYCIANIRFRRIAT